MRIALITLVILFACFASNAQIKVEVEIEKVEPLIQWNVERSGWTFPVFANQVAEISDGELQTIEGIEVQTKIHKLATEQLVFVESCNAEADEKAIAKNERRNYVISNFMTYEYKNKIFAYRATFQIVDAVNGSIRERYGASVIGIYVDEDGEGKFELRCGNMNLNKLPQWIKNTIPKIPPPPPLKKN